MPLLSAGTWCSSKGGHLFNLGSWDPKRLEWFPSRTCIFFGLLQLSLPAGQLADLRVWREAAGSEV